MCGWIISQAFRLRCAFYNDTFDEIFARYSRIVIDTPYLRAALHVPVPRGSGIG
jgi:hypothetical protein